LFDKKSAASFYHSSTGTSRYVEQILFAEISGNANNSATTETKEKISTNFESL